MGGSHNTVFPGSLERNTQLEELTSEKIELLICGGAALNMVGYIDRTTKDVDVIALIKREKSGQIAITKAEKLPENLKKAAIQVQKDFDLADNWLNTGPASVMDWGLPEGLIDRAEIRSYGNSLTVYLLSRYDQIHFKLYATVDQPASKHFDDLKILKPTEQEIEAAARWSMAHDPSEGYKLVLKDFLIKAGYKNAAQRI